MYIYLVRHGETEWNSAGLAQGREDVELNENGLRQAKRLAEAFADTELDEIISSPLSRANKTAEELARSKGLTVQIEPDLIERDYGELSGKPVSAENRPKFFMDMDVPGLEKMEDVGNRMVGVLRRYAQSGRESVLMVSHGAAINATLYKISGGEIGGPKTWLVNTCINLFRCDGDGIHIEKYNLSCDEFENYAKNGSDPA